MRVYEIKEFDYPRATTDAWIRFQVLGEVWEFPAQIAADDRDANYADEEEDTVGFIRAGSLDASDLMDWAINNMNWSDVKEYARRVKDAPALTDEDFQAAWLGEERRFTGEV